jgi:hypothetical protein
MVLVLFMIPVLFLAPALFISLLLSLGAGLASNGLGRGGERM